MAAVTAQRICNPNLVLCHSQIQIMAGVMSSYTQRSVCLDLMFLLSLHLTPQCTNTFLLSPEVSLFSFPV